MCNYCIHLHLPTSGGCLAFSPCVVRMSFLLVQIANVGFWFGMQKWWYYCKIIIIILGIISHRRWTGMVQIKQFASVDHFRRTWFILIQKLNVINIGLLVVTNNNIYVWLIPVLCFIVAFRMISNRYCQLFAASVVLIMLCGLFY